MATKLVDSAQLDADLTIVADAIRTKGGTSGSLSFPTGMASAIENIQAGSGSGGTQPQLNAPTISIAQNTLTISNPAGNGNFATSFDVYFGETFFVNSSSVIVDLSAIQASVMTAEITVNAKGTNFLDSVSSNSETWIRYYAVNIYDDTTLLQTSLVQNGSMVSYEPTKTGSTFDAWVDVNGDPVTVISYDMDIYATWITGVFINAGTYNINTNWFMHVTLDVSVPYTFQVMGASYNLMSPNGTRIAYPCLYQNMNYLQFYTSGTQFYRVVQASPSVRGAITFTDYSSNPLTYTLTPKSITVTATTMVTQEQKDAFDVWFIRV